MKIYKTRSVGAYQLHAGGVIVSFDKVAEDECGSLMLSSYGRYKGMVRPSSKGEFVEKLKAVEAA